MSSAPRRPQRVIYHEVTITADKFENYYRFDQHIEQARMWLQWREKRKNYIVGPATYKSQTFKFKNAGTASMFALKWL